jgi:hypothetical protein
MNWRIMKSQHRSTFNLTRVCGVYLLSVLISGHIACADDKFTDDCYAPNFENRVVLREGNPGDGYKVVILGSEGKAVFSRNAEGFALFAAAATRFGRCRYLT